MAKKIADRAIQVLGGNGYVAEYKVINVITHFLTDWNCIRCEAIGKRMFVIWSSFFLCFEFLLLQVFISLIFYYFDNLILNYIFDYFTFLIFAVLSHLISSLLLSYLILYYLILSYLIIYSLGGASVARFEVAGDRRRHEWSTSQEHDERHEKNWIQNTIVHLFHSGINIIATSIIRNMLAYFW